MPRRRQPTNVTLSPEAREILEREKVKRQRSRSWLVDWAIKKVFGKDKETTR